MSFDKLVPKLSPTVLNALQEFGFHTPTPVQAATIPLFLTNKDVCVEATTGSGKTIAFAIPIFEILLRNATQQNIKLGKYDVGALIVAPTRELATQIFEVVSKFSRHCPAGVTIECVSFIGGTNTEESMARYSERGGQVIVSTPGRLLDMHNRYGTGAGTASSLRCFNLRTLEVLVLDEADVLLDMGFKQSINDILRILPKMRRTGLFSATQTKEVREIARAGMRNPVTVTVRVQMQMPSAPAKTIASSSSAEGASKGAGAAADGKTLPPAAPAAVAPAPVPVAAPVRNSAIPTSLSNYFSVVEYDARPAALLRFIAEHPQEKVIVFCATCACVDYYSTVFHEMLKNDTANASSSQSPLFPPNYHIYGFHGKMIPVKRNAIYQKFVKLDSAGAGTGAGSAAAAAAGGGGGGGMLFCTDVAARGVDIPDVDWIIQWTPPKDPAFYIHRIGRTARAGKKGGALIYIAPSEVAYLQLLKTRNVPLMEHTDSAVEDLSVRAQESMKSVARTDRKVLELSSTAFMAFMKAYQEHICSFIFRLDEVNIGAVARSYGLLKLPKIPETCGRNRARIDFKDDAEVRHTSSIPYKLEAQEAARQRRLKMAAEEKAAEEQAAAAVKGGGGGAAAVGRKGGDSRANNSNSNNNNNNNNNNSSSNNSHSSSNPLHKDEKRSRKAKQSKRQAAMEEWDELAAEETMFKKARKGKVDRESYDELLFNDDKDNALSVNDVVSLALVKGANAVGQKKGDKASSSAAAGQNQNQQRPQSKKNKKAEVLNKLLSKQGVKHVQNNKRFSSSNDLDGGSSDGDSDSD